MSEVNTITYEDYTLFVTRLASKFTMADQLSKIGTMGLGLAGEAAEVSEIAMHYRGVTSNLPLEEETRLKIIDELGDICWYVSFAAGNVVNVPFDSLIVKDVPTLTEIYPSNSLRGLSPQLSTDCGKVADIAKKLVYHGKPYTDDVREKLVERLKAIMHTLVFIVKDVCRAELQDCIDKNVAKLSERYKTLTFSTEEFMAKEEGKSV